MEASGLTDTAARPADILTTTAIPGRSAALDVCVASPSAAIALRCSRCSFQTEIEALQGSNTTVVCCRHLDSSHGLDGGGASTSSGVTDAAVCCPSGFDTRRR